MTDPAAADARPVSRTVPLTPLETAIHWPTGRALGPRPRPRFDDPVRALEAAMLPALQRSPCVVAFSGGRDSSLILALAVRLARREGLPVPVACTYVFPDCPSSHEDGWQELVVRHLGVTEWQRIAVHEEFDVVGELAQRLRADLGPAFPALAHSRELLLEQARGGALLTGEGGDEVLHGARSHAAARLLRLHGRAARTDYRRVADSLAPAFVRRNRTLRQRPTSWPWLRREAARRAAELVAADVAATPYAFGPAVWAVLDRRAHHALRTTARLQAERHDVRAVDPLVDRQFAADWTRSWPVLGPPDRASAMERLGGDVLPSQVVNRRSKAEFAAAFLTARARAFAVAWDGTGVDTDLVDPEALRETWLADRPHGGAAMLLQQAFHASRPLTAGAARGPR